MTKAAIGIVEMKACRRCNSECRVQTFPANGALQTDTTLWMCANSVRLGGQCDEDAYLTAEAWNTRTPDPIIMEMVEALERVRGTLAGNKLALTHIDAVNLLDTLLTKVSGK